MWEHSFIGRHNDLYHRSLIQNLTDRKLLVHTKHNRLFVTNRLQITSHYSREQRLINLLSIKKINESENRNCWYFTLNQNVGWTTISKPTGCFLSTIHSPVSNLRHEKGRRHLTAFICIKMKEKKKKLKRRQTGRADLFSSPQRLFTCTSQT